MPGESNFHRSTGLLTSINQSECSISAQFISSQQIPLRSPTSSYIISKPYSYSTRNPINNWSTFKNPSVSNQSITDITINNNLCLTVSTCTSTNPSTSLSDSFNSHKNISSSSYNHFRSFGFFYPQQRSLNVGLSSYPTSFEYLTDNKTSSGASTNFLKKNPKEVSFSSNCSDLNSDSESIDVSDHDKGILAIESISTTKKRNPHSIEELLKKPEKVKRCSGVFGTSQQPLILNENDDGNNFVRAKPTNQLTIEVYD